MPIPPDYLWELCPRRRGSVTWTEQLKEPSINGLLVIQPEGCFQELQLSPGLRCVCSLCDTLQSPHIL